MATPPTGRPRGRPRGSAAKRRADIDDAIAQAAPDLIARLVDAAKGGDVSAATALLDRVAPKLRPVSVAVCVDLSGTPSEVGKRLLAAVGSGSLPVDVATDIIELTERVTAPSEAFRPMDTEALDRIYEEKLAEMAERDTQFRTRRAEDLVAMGVPHNELSPYLRGESE